MAKKNKDKKTLDTAGNEVRVKIYLRFGSDTRHLRMDFLAKEKRDSYNNLSIMSEEHGFNEDSDFTQDEVYKAMRDTLSLDGLSKEKLVAKLNHDIEKIKIRVGALEKHPELNILANIWDEKGKLRKLLVYEKYMKYVSHKGCYYKVENNIRVYEFESIEGFLIPIWHGCDNLIDYQDNTVKKKITLQERDKLNTILDAKKKENLKYVSLILVLVVCTVLCALFIFGTLKSFSYYNNYEAQCHRPAMESANAMASMTTTIKELFNNEVVMYCLLDQNKTGVVNDIKANIQKLTVE